MDTMEVYPGLENIVMMAAINALCYQIDTQERMHEVMHDMKQFISDQMMMSLASGGFR